jgi:hypothetical protein
VNIEAKMIMILRFTANVSLMFFKQAMKLYMFVVGAEASRPGFANVTALGSVCLS